VPPRPSFRIADEYPFEEHIFVDGVAQVTEFFVVVVGADFRVTD
jgi:hypothetical protein